MEVLLLSLLASLEAVAPEHVLAEARLNIGYREYGVALENLCEQLYEFDVALNEDQAAEIRRAAAKMSMPTDRFEFLIPLTEPGASPHA